MHGKTIVTIVLAVAAVVATAGPVVADDDASAAEEITQCVYIFLDPPGLAVDPRCVPPPVGDLLPDD